MKLLIRLGIWGLNVIYFFHKCFPIKKQVAFISRQSDKTPLDFKMLREQINALYPDIHIVEHYRMIPGDIVGRLKYVFHLIGPQMHAYATSRVVVLDGYSIAASVLKHKKELKIVQMWHAMGSLKRFGYAAIGTGEGSSERLADMFKMHQNYDWILASSQKCIPALAKAFRNPEDKFIEMSLPRTDLLTDINYMTAERGKIQERYPDLSKKKNILYAPTFRKNEDMNDAVKSLIQKIDYTRYNLIVKLHPLVTESVDIGKAFLCEEFSALELLSVADLVVSDYSAFIFEAAVAGKDIAIYAFDLEEYKRNRGFLFDFEKEIPECICSNAVELTEMINEGIHNRAAWQEFGAKYVVHQTECTQTFAKFINALYNNKSY